MTGAMIPKLDKAPMGFYVDHPRVGFTGPYPTAQAAVDTLRSRPDAAQCCVTFWRGKPG